MDWVLIIAAASAIAALNYLFTRVRKLENQHKLHAQQIARLEKRSHDLQLVAVEFGQFIRGLAPNWNYDVARELITDGKLSAHSRQLIREADEWTASRRAHRAAEFDGMN